MKMSDLPPAALASRFDDARLDAARVDGVAEPAPVPLSTLEVDDFATIHSVLPGADDVDRDLVMRLIEIGFVPGERVRVIAIGHPGRQPLAVRLVAGEGGRGSTGGATFAMRRHEADFIRVVPDLPARPDARRRP